MDLRTSFNNLMTGQGYDDDDDDGYKILDDADPEAEEYEESLQYDEDGVPAPEDDNSYGHASFDEDGEDYHDGEDDLQGGDQLIFEEDEPDDRDDLIPQDVGASMNAAVRDSGLERGADDVIFEDDQEAMKEYDQLLDEDATRDNRRERRRRIRESNLSDEQRALVGRANMAYATNNLDEALQILHEVIRGAPSAKGPWITLAAVLEAKGETEKAIQTNLIAAHLGGTDANLWKKIAVDSRQIGNLDQAIYCINKAVRLDKEDLNAQWDRAVLLIERGLYSKAIAGFRAILNISPHNPQVIRELGKLLARVNQPREAINLYEDLYELDKMNPLEPVDEDDEDDELDLGARVVVPCRMRYADINTLAGLYIRTAQYDRCINTIRQCVRRLQGRARDTHWDFRPDDQEFYETAMMPENQRMPMELRTQLGICRLMLDQVDIAVDHFSKLYQPHVVPNHIDLMMQVAEAFIKKGLFENALATFEVLRSSREHDADVSCRVAFCHFQLKNYSLAEQWYRHVLALKPDLLQAKKELRQLYTAMGEEEKAFELGEEIEAAAPGERDRKPPADPNQPSKTKINAAAKAKKRAEEQERERILSAENITLYRSAMEAYREVEDPGSRVRFIREAKKLLSKFTSAKAFYGDKHRRAPGFKTRGKPQHSEDDSWLGLTIEQWYQMFIRLSHLLNVVGESAESQQVLKTCLSANVFHHDEVRSAKLHIHMMNAALVNDNIGMAAEHARWFISYRPFVNDTYQLFSAALSIGTPEALHIYTQANTIKLLGRQLKSFEKLIRQGKKHEFDINIMMLVLYGHVSNCARNFDQAIWYFRRALQQVPEDPFVHLSLGIAFLHKGHQRKTEEKHKAFTCIFKYYELSEQSAEAAYNVARALHQCGLRELALDYYNHVLSAPAELGKQNLKREAAYNVHLLLMERGDSKEAFNVLREYIQIA
ncbi:hypothetical protein SmJEL517_g00634 [Synchytrium microbalum]|uniref:TPR-like protein n=1 Tax=Synchytrium microbalum TaxID=1806994 RepID=A0A507CIP5_9FUNG|nr:uncharacterized protein SmJEL517_g00634 [Synchytrium microbalum]TPX37605.1 hypothetical protein SmJEL517_g00634 [Synchytrium microbalum]